MQPRIVEAAQAQYETVVREILPELEDSKDMIMSQLNLKPKNYIWEPNGVRRKSRVD